MRTLLLQTVTCDVVAIFAMCSLAAALSLDQGDFPPATAAHLLPLKFVSCHPTSLDQAGFLGIAGYKFQLQ